MSCWGFYSLIILILLPQKLFNINRLLINLCPYRSRYIWPHLLVIWGEYEEGGVGEDGDLPIFLKLRCFCCCLQVRICFAHPSSEDKCKWILFLMKGQRRKERRFNVKWLLIFFLLPFLQFHLVCCPVQDCKCKCLEKNVIFFPQKILRLPCSPPSLFAFPTPAPVALFLHPLPGIQLESKTH